MNERTTWRLLPWRKDDSYTSMAIDKTIAESVAAGNQPTIRFYYWAGNGAVSYGASQAVTDIAVDFCQREGIPYVRRFTEARAMYHGPTDLTYAIAAPVSLYKRRIDIGAATSSGIIYFLERLGLRNVSQAGYTSVMINGRKISGSVPYFEKKEALFQHGSVFCKLEYERIANVYRIPEEVLRETTTSIEEQRREIGEIGEIGDIFQESFLEGKNWELGELTEQEQERITHLREVFATEEWFSGGEKARGACSMHWGIPIAQIVRNILKK